jgi:ABC-2 type transport system permease protein
VKRRARERRLVGRLRPVVQTAGFVRKEIVEIARQPRLLLVLVAGPFVVLLLFAVGYDQKQAVLRTAFIGPEGSVYEESMTKFTDQLSNYVISEGYSSDLRAAERRLEDGHIDLIVVFPEDPAASVMDGRQAVIRIVHDKIDPIQQTAVEISAQLAVQELNGNVLEAVVTRAQSELVPLADSVVRSDDLVARIESAVNAQDDEEVRALALELQDATTQMSAITAATGTVSDELELERSAEEQQQLDNLAAAVDELDGAARRIADAGAQVSPADVETAKSAVGNIDQLADAVLTLDPAIVVRPFVSETANVLRQRVGVNDYFAPAAIALLLQHMVLTFAAMGLVTDRSLGLFEVFRVGPIGAGPVLIGKYSAYLLVGSVVGAALVAAVHFALDVPLRGDLRWLVGGLLGLLVASIGVGMVLSLVARSESQAVQYAMLALLAGLFFGGFFLDLDAFRYPVKLFSWVLPVTYGVRLMRDVMLRGVDPATTDVLGLAATAIVFGLLARVLLARRLRVE